MSTKIDIKIEAAIACFEEIIAHDDQHAYTARVGLAVLHAALASAVMEQAQPVVKIGTIVRYLGDTFKVICHGDTPLTFDLHVHPLKRAGDQWRNVPSEALTPIEHPVQLTIPVAWSLIDDNTPRDNKRMLYFAKFELDGRLKEIDFDGIWEHETGSWETPENYWYWASANGIEEPTHWAYQDEALPAAMHPVQPVMKCAGIMCRGCEGCCENLPDAVKAQPAQPTTWKPINTAPRDGTIIRLLVEFKENSLEDTSDSVQTIGHSNSDHDQENEWQFAGWCWTHDIYTQGKGVPIGWLPFADQVVADPVQHQPVQQVQPIEIVVADQALLKLSQDTLESVKESIKTLRQLECREPVAEQWWGIITMALHKAYLAAIIAQPAKLTFVVTDEDVDAAIFNSGMQLPIPASRQHFRRALEAFVSSKVQQVQPAEQVSEPVHDTKRLASFDAALRIYVDSRIKGEGKGLWSHNLQAVEYEVCEYAEKYAVEVMQTTPVAPVAKPAYYDDLVIDKFAAAMKKKLKKQHDKGYSGWETCPIKTLQKQLIEHIDKGDPIDVANFAMMLWNRDEPTKDISTVNALNLAGWFNREDVLMLNYCNGQSVWAESTDIHVPENVPSELIPLYFESAKSNEIVWTIESEGFPIHYSMSIESATEILKELYQEWPCGLDELNSALRYLRSLSRNKT